MINAFADCDVSRSTKRTASCNRKVEYIDSARSKALFSKSRLDKRGQADWARSKASPIQIPPRIEWSQRKARSHCPFRLNSVTDIRPVRLSVLARRRTPEGWERGKEYSDRTVRKRHRLSLKFADNKSAASRRGARRKRREVERFVMRAKIRTTKSKRERETSRIYSVVNKCLIMTFVRIPTSWQGESKESGQRNQISVSITSRTGLPKR